MVQLQLAEYPGKSSQLDVSRRQHRIKLFCIYDESCGLFGTGMGCGSIDGPCEQEIFNDRTE
jgi:hypothetical protein